MPLVKISEYIKNGPKNLKNISTENLGKNKVFPALGKSQRSLQDHIACSKVQKEKEQKSPGRKEM